MLDLQIHLKEEREQTERVLDNNVDKRTLFELEKTNKLLKDKNTALYTQVVT